MTNKDGLSSAGDKDGSPIYSGLAELDETAWQGSSEDFVYGALKDAIARGELPPGERVTETGLATMLGVSRTPIRAAIKILEEQRLLERKPGVGLVVTDLSFEQLDDIYTTRSVLMGLAARLAAQRMASRDQLKLQALQEEIEALTEAEAFQELATVNDAFHDVIVRASRNESLIALLGQIHLSIIRFRHTTLLFPGRAGKAMEEHRRLIGALVDRDEEAAEHIGREHVMNAHYARLKQQAALEIEKVKAEAVRNG